MVTGIWSLVTLALNQHLKKAPPKRKAPNAKKGGAGSPSTMSDMFSAPQHFTANTKTPPKQKMARIPKITEKVTLPSASSLMGGMGGFPGMGLAPGMTPGGALGMPGMNPLLPMNLYGFGGMGGIPPNLIPGLNSNLLNTMAFMQQAAANAAAAGRDSDTVTLDDELEEGEISPPDTPTPPKPTKQKQTKKEPSPDVEIIVEKKDP